MRLIDAEWLLRLVCGRRCGCNPDGCGCEDYHECEIGAYIKEAPTVDSVTVVRCKDCKHNGTWQCHMEYDEYHPEADIHHEMHGDDDFCSYGERKDGDSNDK